jgi:sulfide:quinone oxidoreductase
VGKRIVVVGSSFAGLTAAIEMANRGGGHEVVCISKSRELLFFPSLIWVPFGLRERDDVSFDVAPVLEKKGVRYVEANVTEIDLARRSVASAAGVERYDYLVIATGPEPDYDAIPGFGPKHGHAQSIFSWDDAMKAREAWERFVREPGPIVIGGVQGTGCFGAAYEFLFNVAHQVRKNGLAERAPITWVTAEPFLGHFGIGGFGAGRRLTEMFMAHAGITAITDAAVKEIRPREVELDDGRVLPFAFSMFAPAYRGVAPVRALTSITDARGFVRVDGTYRTLEHPEVYAAGVAVAVAPPGPTRVPCGVPKTGYASEEMARIAVHNIVADIEGSSPLSLPVGAIDAKCVLDAGNNGIIMTADHLLAPRDHAWLIPGPQAHWAKVAFEKYFLATRRRGIV